MGAKACGSISRGGATRTLSRPRRRDKASRASPVTSSPAKEKERTPLGAPVEPAASLTHTSHGKRFCRFQIPIDFDQCDPFEIALFSLLRLPREPVGLGQAR